MNNYLTTEDVIFILDHNPEWVKENVNVFVDIASLASDIEDAVKKYYLSLDENNPPNWEEVAKHVFCEYVPYQELTND